MKQSEGCYRHFYPKIRIIHLLYLLHIYHFNFVIFVFSFLKQNNFICDKIKRACYYFSTHQGAVYICGLYIDSCLYSLFRLSFGLKVSLFSILLILNFGTVLFFLHLLDFLFSPSHPPISCLTAPDFLTYRKVPLSIYQTLLTFPFDFGEMPQ